MTLNIITFFLVVVFVLTYMEHMKHDHYKVAPIMDIAPERSAEMLGFIEGCKQERLIITELGNGMVSCT